MSKPGKIASGSARSIRPCLRCKAPRQVHRLPAASCRHVEPELPGGTVVPSQTRRIIFAVGPSQAASAGPAEFLDHLDLSARREDEPPDRPRERGPRNSARSPVRRLRPPRRGRGHPRFPGLAEQFENLQVLGIDLRGGSGRRVPPGSQGASGAVGLAFAAGQVDYEPTVGLGRRHVDDVVEPSLRLLRLVLGNRRRSGRFGLGMRVRRPSAGACPPFRTARSAEEDTPLWAQAPDRDRWAAPGSAYDSSGYCCSNGPEAPRTSAGLGEARNPNLAQDHIPSPSPSRNHIRWSARGRCWPVRSAAPGEIVEEGRQAAVEAADYRGNRAAPWRRSPEQSPRCACKAHPPLRDRSRGTYTRPAGDLRAARAARDNSSCLGPSPQSRQAHRPGRGPVPWRSKPALGREPPRQSRERLSGRFPSAPFVSVPRCSPGVGNRGLGLGRRIMRLDPD